MTSSASLSLSPSSSTQPQTPVDDLKCSICGQGDAKKCVQIFNVKEQSCGIEERYQVKEVSIRCESCFLKRGSGLYCEIRCGDHAPIGECYFCHRNMCPEHYRGKCRHCNQHICIDCGTNKDEDKTWCECKLCELEVKIRQLKDDGKRCIKSLEKERAKDWIHVTSVAPMLSCRPNRSRPFLVSIDTPLDAPMTIKYYREYPPF